MNQIRFDGWSGLGDATLVLEVLVCSFAVLVVSRFSVEGELEWLLDGEGSRVDGFARVLFLAELTVVGKLWEIGMFSLVFLAWSRLRGLALALANSSWFFDLCRGSWSLDLWRGSWSGRLAGARDLGDDEAIGIMSGSSDLVDSVLLDDGLRGGDSVDSDLDGGHSFGGGIGIGALLICDRDGLLDANLLDRRRGNIGSLRGERRVDLFVHLVADSLGGGVLSELSVLRLMSVCIDRAPSSVFGHGQFDLLHLTVIRADVAFGGRRGIEATLEDGIVVVGECLERPLANVDRARGEGSWLHEE